MKVKFILITAIIVLGIVPTIIIPEVHAQPTVTGKYVIITMDDGPIGQYTYGKPVLDTYGYKASFMIVCNWVGMAPRMTWSQIANMASDGQDIESHTMTHPDLTHLSASQLQNELGGSQNCLKQHGYNTTVFAYPRNLGSENSTVVNVVSKYYQTAKTLFSHNQTALWFLTCNGYQSPLNQTNCSTYTPGGKLQYANQYGVRFTSLDNLEQAYNFNDTAVYNVFVPWINSQTEYNINGGILAIPVVTLHEIVDPATPSSWLNTNQVLFAHILQYLHDNNFTVLTMKDLSYNSNTNTMYVKGLMQPTQTVATVLSLNSITSPSWGNQIIVSGKLTTASGSPLSGKTINFTGSGAINMQSVTTNPDGTFTATGISPNIVGSVWNTFHVNGVFVGDSTYTSSSAIQFYNTNKHLTALTLTVSPSSVPVNGTYSVSGTLTDTTTGTALSGMTISFSGTPITIGSTVTDSNGNYLLNGLVAPSTVGSYSIKSQFAVTSLYDAVNSAGKTLSVTPPVGAIIRF